MFRSAARAVALLSRPKLARSVTDGTQFDIARIADELASAELSRIPIAAPSTTSPRFDVEDAYGVQSINIARKVAAGETRVGHKVGLTSLAMQKQLGVDQPDFGVITDRMVIANGGTVDVGELIAPRAEAEFAFRIGADLAASPTIDALRAAIDGVAVAIEVIDSRIADWKITLVDTVADNASSARIVYGRFMPATDELIAALPSLTAVLEQDGEEKVSGLGSAVLGDPLISLHWLATAIGAFGDGFRAGDVVLAGAVASAVPLVAGSSYAVSADGFDTVTLHAISAD